MITAINSIKAILKKEIKSEIRTKSSISSIVLFVAISVLILAFSTAGSELSTDILSSFVWIVIFFTSMVGQSRVFVLEEERQTSLWLKTIASSSTIYIGKLLYNILLGLILNIISVLLIIIFFNINLIENVLSFWLILIIGSIGISGASTIISALIAKAGSKNALFPILSFPVLIPIIMLGLESTSMSIAENNYSFFDNFLVMFAFGGTTITISYLLFEYVWDD